MHKYLTIFFLLCNVTLLAQPRVKQQRLRVADNHRFLAYADGSPFFYLGDTGWELFHRLTLEEAAVYFDDRAAKGFTVIQAVVLAEFDGLHRPNAYGHTPLRNDDPAQPDEAYFKDVDAFIRLAAQKGLYIGLLPTWGDKVFKNTWGKGPEIFTAANARTYGAFLGRRYKDQWNIIWILGGDRNPRGEQDIAIWRALAAGIEAGVGGADKALMTFHPQPHANGGSSVWFHEDAWLDFNMLQTGHCRNGNNYLKIQHDYRRQPVKPVMDGEPLYEDHPVCFNAPQYGHSNADDIRKLAYWQLFAGAHGHTYGCHDIWQFYTPEREPVNLPQRPWRTALQLPGAQQMGYVKKLMLSQSVLDRVPDQDLVAGDNPQDSSYIAATRAADGHYAFVYTPTGKTLQVRTRALKGGHLHTRWYNPRSGVFSKEVTLPKEPVMSFKPPSGGPATDWVLVLTGS